ncbi:MAG: hypothetical protein WKF62_08845 [Solirubrobacterales bacterium]
MAGEPEIVRVEDDGLLPLVARLEEGPPPRLLVKSGRVGGSHGERGSLAITDREREVAVEHALAPSARWERDPDFGFELLVSEVPGVAQELLIPRFLYHRADRIYEYAAAVPEAKRHFAEVTH